MLLNFNDELRVINLNFYFLVAISFFVGLLFILFYFGLLCIIPHTSCSVIFHVNEPQFVFLAFSNVEKIGLCLFTQFGFLLIICGFLMFVSILGCYLIVYKERNNENNKQK